MKTNRYCMVIEIKDKYVKAYADIHRNVWPELLKAYKDAGAKELLVWVYKNMAIIYYECESIDMIYEKVAEYEVSKKWSAKLVPWFAQAPDFSGSAKVQTCDKVMDLNQQLNGKLEQY